MITKLYAITVWFHQFWMRKKAFSAIWMWCENCQKCRQMLDRKLSCHCVTPKPQWHERILYYYYYFMQWFIAHCKHEYHNAEMKRKKKYRPSKQVLYERKKLMFIHDLHTMNYIWEWDSSLLDHWVVSCWFRMTFSARKENWTIDRNESILISEKKSAHVKAFCDKELKLALFCSYITIIMCR